MQFNAFPNEGLVLFGCEPFGSDWLAERGVGGVLAQHTGAVCESIMNAAVLAYYESLRLRQRPASTALAIKTLHNNLRFLGDTARPNGGERAQAQIVLTLARRDPLSGDDCVLTVVSGVYDRLLGFMMDYREGLEGVRADRPHVSPLRLPLWMQSEREMRRLNEIISYLYTAHAYGPDAAPRWKPAQIESADAWFAFVKRVDAHWDRLRMPAERVVLSIIRPRASVGSVVLWKGYHGNSPALEPFRPCGACFVDYARRSTFPADLLAQSAAILANHPWEISAGSVATRHAGYNDWANRQAGRTGGLSRLGAELTDTHRYLAGEPTDPGHPLVAMLTDAQLEAYERDSYLVVPPEQIETFVPTWSALVAATVADLSQFMSDVVLRAEQMEGEHAELDLMQADDPRWEAVGGSCDAAERHFGDRYAMYKRNSNGKRGRNAQAGGSLLTKESGMGAAANLYDSPAQMLLQLHLYPMFAQLYKTRELVWLPERCRVRTNDTASLPIHTDTKVSW